MAKKAIRNHLTFRPHFKTHQSAEIGEWFREAGVNAITVSSVSMAHYFADHGWKDITIAFPCNILEISQINELASRIRLNLLVESTEVASFLANNIHSETGFFVKIDTGYHRTGIAPKDIPLLNSVLDAAETNKKLVFKGFLTHTGQTYQAGSLDEIRSLAIRAMETMSGLKEIFNPRFPGLTLSIGDTPSCSLLDEFPGIDEIRPGNFIFYDLMQYSIGSCTLDDIAVAIACPVVAVHPERNEAVIYGGAAHLSKESLMHEGKFVFGLAVKYDRNVWNCNIPFGFVTSLSQEHGIIRINKDVKLQSGELIAILPVHSCLAVHELCMNKVVIEER